MAEEDGEPTPTRIDVDALPDAPNPTDHKKELDEAVGASEVGVNVFVAQPGQMIPFGRHYHPNQEEFLYVVEGTVTMETAEGEFEVGANEAVFVPPGARQKATAAGDEPVRVIAIGAPKAADEAVLVEYCPACEERTGRDFDPREEDGDHVMVLSCAECGTETGQYRAGPS